MEEDHDAADWGDAELSPPGGPIELALTTSTNGPDITSMTWVQSSLEAIRLL
jgi:hypothetical protein